MLQRLEKVLYQEIEKKTAALSFPLIRAVICGQQNGNVYTNATLTTLFILHQSGFGYCLSDNDSSTSKDVVNFLSLSKELPDYFHLYEAPTFLLNDAAYAEKYNSRIRKRIQLKISKEHIQQEAYSLPEGFYIEEITATNYSSLQSLDFAVNKFYKSREDFLRNGIGVCIFDQNDKAVSLCYSACIVDYVTEIDIITIPQYRNQGLGRIAATAFIATARRRGISPNWDCFEENQASLKTALKLGFSIQKEYTFLSLYKR